MSAELNDLSDKVEDALAKYDAAIEKAAHLGSTRDQAFGEQRLGEFYLRRGQEEAGVHHLRLSIELFKQWGAFAKVDQLAEKHNQVLATTSAR